MGHRNSQSHLPRSIRRHRIHTQYLRCCCRVLDRIVCISQVRHNMSELTSTVDAHSTNPSTHHSSGASPSHSKSYLSYPSSASSILCPSRPVGSSKSAAKKKDDIYSVVCVANTMASPRPSSRIFATLLSSSVRRRSRIVILLCSSAGNLGNSTPDAVFNWSSGCRFFRSGLGLRVLPSTVLQSSGSPVSPLRNACGFPVSTISHTW